MLEVRFIPHRVFLIAGHERHLKLEVKVLLLAILSKVLRQVTRLTRSFNNFCDQPRVWDPRHRLASLRANFPPWKLEVSGEEAVLVALKLGFVSNRFYI